MGLSCNDKKMCYIIQNVVNVYQLLVKLQQALQYSEVITPHKKFNSENTGLYTKEEVL